MVQRKRNREKHMGNSIKGSIRQAGTFDEMYVYYTYSRDNTFQNTMDETAIRGTMECPPGTEFSKT